MTIAFTPATSPGSSVVPQVSQIWRTNIIAGYLILAAVCSGYAQSRQQTFLSPDTLDGFTVQVNYIWNYFAGRNSILDLDPLLWIHVIRALIAYVFVTIEDTLGIGMSTFVMLILYVPVINQFSKTNRGFLAFAIPFSTLVFSPRTTLVIISVSYLVMFILKGKSYLYLTFSLIFSSLSSGAVLNNLIISVILARNHRPRSVGLYVYSAALMVSLFVSLADKYEGFTEQRAGYSSTVYGASGIGAIISRSTIFVSIQEGNLARSAAYIGLAVLAMLLLFVSIRVRQYRGYAAILLSAIPSVFLEGLGFVSLLVPVLLLMAGRPLPWRSELVEQAVD